MFLIVNQQLVLKLNANRYWRDGDG